MRVAVVPAGTWGTALSVPLAEAGCEVRLWSRRPGFAAALNATRRHPHHLTDVALPAAVAGCDSLAEAMEGAGLVVIAAASHGLAATCRALRPHLSGEALLLSVTKGLDPGTLRRMSEVILGELPEAAGRLAVLSGPNFAAEVAQRLPTATVVAGPQPVTRAWQDALNTNRLRVYTSEDMVGVELGGALKNVIAVGVGIADGVGLGMNARAGLITRGLAEMTRLGRAMGAQAATFAGLSGLGDLVLTCTGELSRNRQAGLAIGRGQSITQFIRETGYTVEGVPTATAAWSLARRYGVSMPIAGEIFSVLYENKHPLQALDALMTRNKTQEQNI